MTTMNPMYKSKWINALRSGEFKQGRKVLHNTVENTYCCLGVLCHILAKDGVIVAKDHEIEVDGELLQVTRFSDVEDSFEGETGLLPKAACEAVGLVEYGTRPYDEDERIYHEDPMFLVQIHDHGPSQELVSTLNDIHDFTFEQIADLIEAQL